MTPVASTTPVPEPVTPTEDREEASSTTSVPEPATPTDREVDLSERLGASGASEGAAEPAGGAAAQPFQEDKIRPEAGAAAVEPTKDEADESIAEDISIATDSELERVISSAAAAVEEFSGHMVAEPGAEESSEGSDNIFVLRDNKATARLQTGALYFQRPKITSEADGPSLEQLFLKLIGPSFMVVVVVSRCFFSLQMSLQVLPLAVRLEVSHAPFCWRC